MDFLSQLFGGIGNALGGAGKSIGGFLGNAGGGLMNMFGRGTGGASNSGYTGAQNMTQAMGGPNQLSFGAAPQTATKSGVQQDGGLFNPMQSMGLGIGAMGLGQLLGGKTKAPNLNTPQVGAYQNFTANPPQLPQSMQDSINQNLSIKEDQENRNLQAVYKSLRPGTDYTTDSNYQRDLANLNRQQQSDRANALMGPTLQYLQPQQQAMADQAQMSMYQPMLQYGQQTAQSGATKNMFGNLGSMFMGNALWPQGVTNMNSIMKLFGGG